MSGSVLQAVAAMAAIAGGGRFAPPVGHTVTLSSIVKDMIAKGYHPSAIRQELQRRGISWSYRFTGGHASIRERTRNLKRVGMKPCSSCSNGFPIDFEGDTCLDCLAEKWSPDAGH